MPNTGRRIVIVVLALALVLTAGGWVASGFMKTPADIAAAAKPPSTSVITAEVTKQVISNQVVTRGTVSSNQLTNVLAGREAAGASVTVVTGDPIPVGEEVQNGDVIVQLSGRPVFALEGAFPAYRDLAEGSVGPDVTQMQAALYSLDFFDGEDPEGTYGARTSAAVSALYESIGQKGQVGIPASEVFFVSSFPARIESENMSIGSLASEATLNVSTGVPTIRVAVDPQISAVAKPGTTVEIVSETLNQTTTGKVSGGVPADPQSESPTAESTAVPAESQTGESSGNNAQMIEIVPDAPLLAEWIGQDVRVTFIDGSSQGEVLAVPVTAVSLRADGATVVTVVSTDVSRTETTIEVATGVTGAGYVEVTPLGDSALAPGDDVLIGTA